MSDPDIRALHEMNRKSWDAATGAHNSHKHDQAGFLARGGSTLFPEELELLGNLAGLRLVHLQCNAGQDTLSLAQHGAHVTGVDFSGTAIALAESLSADSRIPARFVHADLYDWFDEARERNELFNIVFSSYGSICWLSDLERWARGICAVLAPGGRFVTVDFHPLLMMYDEHFTPRYPYFGDGRPVKWEDGIQDYVAVSGAALAPSGYEEGVRDFQNPHPVFEFQWHLGAIFGAVLRAGLRIERFEEYPYLNGAKLFPAMQTGADRRLYPPEGVPAIPLMFALAARKPDLL